MSLKQIAALHLEPRRDEHGNPVFMGTGAKVPAPRAIHDLRMYMLNIRDPETVETLWREQEERLKARTKTKMRRRR